MKSRWFKSKNKAVDLRKQGLSIIKIEKLLKIPRSTLSGWFKNIGLNDKQKKILFNNQKRGLIEARKKAALWHNAQKEKRIKEAKAGALKIIENIDINDKNILEIALAILYLGEGAKTSDTAIGNSDPLILKFFLTLLKNLYKIEPEKIKCQLSLRADQNPEKIKKFWAKELDIPEVNFNHINFDKRTIGSKTYSDYKGVCYLRCGNIAIQRKLIYLSNIFCEKVIKNK